MVPNLRPYRTSDGHIAVLIYNDKHWNAFVEAVRPPWANEGHATLAQRARSDRHVNGLLAETIKQRPRRNGRICRANSRYRPRR